MALGYLACAGCAATPPPPALELFAPPPPHCAPEPARRALDTFVRGNRPRYAAAMTRARAYLDALEVDPIKLRASHLKGKKKLVEALDAYARLYEIAAPEARPAIRARVGVLAQATLDARYHDMQTSDDRDFHEDATSYLRAALLLDRMGIDVSRYRAEIAAMKPRLDQHMRERGAHQRRTFHAYYQHFGLAEPFPLEGALGQGLIARKPDPDTLERADVYALTHEVYAAYEFGDKLDEEPFADPERLYLRGALPRLVVAWQGHRDPDLVAELVTSLRYLRFTGDPVYAEALGYLLDGQNASGSWGSYEPLRARFGDLVEQGFYLHTTMVAIEALSFGFEPLFRRGEGPECP
jgi:hypothetical protein